MARDLLIKRLRAAVTGHAAIHAAWLEGSDALGHADEFSDIDLWLDVQAGQEDWALELVRGVVQSFGPLNVEDNPQHSHPQIRQRFYGSSGLSPFWFVDVCVQTHGREVAFGPADAYALWFDRSGVIRRADAEPFDAAAELERLQTRRWRFVLVEKELQRGHNLEALNYYHSEVLALLVRVLRVIHCPDKRDYGLKHLDRDLPPDVSGRLAALYAYNTPQDLRLGVAQVGAWLDEMRWNI